MSLSSRHLCVHDTLPLAQLWSDYRKHTLLTLRSACGQLSALSTTSQMPLLILGWTVHILYSFFFFLNIHWTALLSLNANMLPRAPWSSSSGQNLNMLAEEFSYLTGFFPLGTSSLLHHYLTAICGHFSVYFQLVPQVPTWAMLHSTSS